MVNHKITIIGIILLFITVMLVSPVFGRFMYQAANPQGPPRWLPKYHGRPAGYVERMEFEQVNLLAGAAEFIDGGFKAMGKTVETVFGLAEGVKIKPVGEVYEPRHKRTGWRRGLPERLW